VDARDRYGNLTAVPQACLRAQATGPQGAVPLSPLELLPGDAASTHPQQQRRLGATFTAAGSYGLAVCVVDPDTQVRLPARLCHRQPTCLRTQYARSSPNPSVVIAPSCDRIVCDFCIALRRSPEPQM